MKARMTVSALRRLVEAATASNWSDSELDQAIKDHGWDKLGRKDQVFKSVVNMTSSYDFAHAICDRLDQKNSNESLSVNEAEDAPPETQKVEYEPLELDSLDTKIDSFLVKAENPEASTNESLYFNFEKFLKEAPEDEEQQSTDAEQPADAVEPQQPEKIDNDASTPDKQLDVHHFAAEIARLSENFENLVDIKGTILRRSFNYVGKNYGADVAKQVEDVLEQNFSISLEKEDPEYDIVPPPAAGAGPGSSA